jgi:hypothetical protein
MVARTLTVPRKAWTPLAGERAACQLEANSSRISKPGCSNNAAKAA